jgi:hypothetical protein
MRDRRNNSDMRLRVQGEVFDAPQPQSRGTLMPQHEEKRALMPQHEKKRSLMP